MRKKSRIILKLLEIVKSMTGVMIVAIVLGVLGFLAAIFIPVLGGMGLFQVFKEHQISSFIFVAMIILAISRGFLRYGEQACNHYVAFKILAILRDKIFTVLRTLAPAKLEGKDKGNLIAVITSDIELLEVFYAHTISPVCIAFIMTIIMSVFMGSYHPILGIIAFSGYGLVGVGIPILISRVAQKYGDSIRNQIGEISNTILDNVRGVSESIQYNCGEEKLQTISELTEEMSVKEKALKLISGKSTAMINAVILLFGMIILVVSSYLYTQGIVALDAVILSTITMLSSFGPVIAVANLGTGLSYTFASANRVLDLLEEKPAVEETYGEGNTTFEGIEIQNISFSYEDDEIVNDCSLNGRKNKILGIAGKSGAGKSTLLKLLMRFWDVDHGKISISNTDIKELKTNNLRNLESFVTQETILFKDTIENNLKIANPNATKEQIIEACKKASLHDFINALPDGYETMVGELGDTLSGGERQRIGVARAFLHDAPLILLDEPTSNLDNLNEAIILKALKQQKDKTIVLVSHRPSTLCIADDVVQMKEGKIIYE
ncbi:ABC transporter ATP-binding protein [Anaerorhabdus sp.]|nr:ABC transporter ATP-binding protein [Anaerorhabdus sp.]MEA4875770.1 ABC transporter ATP-binding protein [Anaerorhabdus sp.]